MRSHLRLVETVNNNRLLDTYEGLEISNSNNLMKSDEAYTF